MDSTDNWCHGCAKDFGLGDVTEEVIDPIFKGTASERVDRMHPACATRRRNSYKLRDEARAEAQARHEHRMAQLVRLEQALLEMESTLNNLQEG
jgi:hypothetical protein